MSTTSNDPCLFHRPPLSFRRPKVYAQGEGGVSSSAGGGDRGLTRCSYGEEGRVIGCLAFPVVQDVLLDVCHPKMCPALQAALPRVVLGRRQLSYTPPPFLSCCSVPGSHSLSTDASPHRQTHVSSCCCCCCCFCCSSSCCRRSHTACSSSTAAMEAAPALGMAFVRRFAVDILSVCYQQPSRASPPLSWLLGGDAEHYCGHHFCCCCCCCCSGGRTTIWPPQGSA
mmetsp:Transcript_37259/g.59847  ORF Transcript_37259/g.59847 Transcript_37259/m.59847 type:complete len:226 (-) Transcript_37259:595-1272(-)